MNQTLSVETILNNEFIIKKLLVQSELSNVYLAVKENDQNDKFVVKEIFPPENYLSDPAKLNEKRKEIMHTVDTLTHFDPTNCARVYKYFYSDTTDYVVMEYIEGMTIKELKEISIASIKENEILRWIYQLCDALNICMNRPYPFIFDVLDSKHIIIDNQRNIKLINFGIDKFYESQWNFRAFSSNTEDLSRVINKFARMVYLMYSGTEFNNRSDFKQLPIKPEFARLLERLNKVNSFAVFKNFIEIKNEIIKALSAQSFERKMPENKTYSVLKKNTLFENIGIFFKSIAEMFLSQKMLYFIIEISALIIILSVILITFGYEKTFTKRSPCFFVLSNNRQIIIIDKKTNKEIDKFMLNGNYNNLICNKNGSLIFLTKMGKKEIDIIKTDKFHIIKKIRTDSIPDKILLSPDEKKLYVTMEDSNNLVSYLLPDNLKSEDINPEFIITFKSRPSDIKYDIKNKLLFICEAATFSICVIDPEKGRFIKRIFIMDYPLHNRSMDSSIDVSKISNEFYVSFAGSEIVYRFSYDNKKGKFDSELTDKYSFSSEVHQILLDNKAFLLLSLLQSLNELEFIHLKSNKKSESINLSKYPLKMILVDANELWVLHKNGYIYIINPYTKEIYFKIKLSGKVLTDFCFSK